MPRIRPFEGYVVREDRATEVISPAYDTMTPEERLRYAQAHPRNYLNALRSIDDYPEEARPAHDALLEANRAYIAERLAERTFRCAGRACIFLYRLEADGHAQTGVVAEIPLSEYAQGRIKRHEHTHRDKEDQLVRYREVVRASSSPVCLAYASDAGIERLIEEREGRAPMLDHLSADGVRHAVWCVDDEPAQRRFVARFEAIPHTYLTDGHHRTAAAARHAAARGGAEDEDGSEDEHHLLVALFPHDRLRILAYNRCVRDLGRYSPESFLAALDGGFAIERLEITDPERARPRRRGEFTMLLDGRWFRLTPRPPLPDPVELVAALDVSVLQERLLGPLLGIEDPRADARLGYLAGALGLRGLVDATRERYRVAFAVHPASIGELMAVADAGAVMPPKSTWFDPKLRSGIFLVTG